MITNNKKLKEEIRHLVLNKAHFWMKHGKYFPTYYGAFGSLSGHEGLSFEVSRHWYSTKIVVGYSIPTGDDWSPYQRVSETFLYDGILMYNSIRDKYEAEEQRKAVEEEMKRKRAQANERKLKEKILIEIIENAKTKNDSYNRRR